MLARRRVILSGPILIGLFVLSACSTMKIDDFRATEPPFILEDYFQGEVRASGLFEDRFGNVRREFVVDIAGTWDGTTLVLNEEFLYSDGETETRVWSITRTGPNDYIGKTQQAIGEAVGKRAGNAFNWQYDFKLQIGDDNWKVHFDDWMFLQPNGTLLNKATVTRWGLKIGTVFLSFQKVPSEQTEQAAIDIATTTSPLSMLESA
jgi:hypothetical protein